MTNSNTTAAYEADVSDLTDIATAIDDLAVHICSSVAYAPDREAMFVVLRTLRMAQRNLVTRHLTTDVCRDGHTFQFGACIYCEATL